MYRSLLASKRKFMFPRNCVIEGSPTLVNEAGEEQPLRAGDFAFLNPSEKHQLRNQGDGS